MHFIVVIVPFNIGGFVEKPFTGYFDGITLLVQYLTSYKKDAMLLSGTI